MRIIEPYIEIIDRIDGLEIIKKIERIGRVCYKSENRITRDSSKKFVQRLIERGHESVIEHEKISVKFVCDRGVSHEIVRHRLASYSQESTRYCNYSKESFGKEITVIKPLFWNENSEEYETWFRCMREAERAYFELINRGATPQEARSVLPNSLKTEIVITMNLREWRHFFKLRTSEAAHPQMREVACKALVEIKRIVPVVFDDLDVSL